MSVATAFETDHVLAGAAGCPAGDPYERPVRRRLALVPAHGAPLPPPARVPSEAARGASVRVLRAPVEVDSPPLRLTRRGVVVLSLAVVLLGAALVWIAMLSAPASGGAPAHGPSAVTVSDGDTLWSIAHRVAPAADPRAEVSRLQRLNHLDGVDLVPGQHLRVR